MLLIDSNSKFQIPAKKINALTIIVINALLPLVNSLYPSHKGIIFSQLVSLLVIFLAGYYLKLLKATGFLVLFYSSYMLSSIYFNIGILTSFFRMSLLFIPYFLLAWLLCTEYNSSELLSALQGLHLPKLFLIGLMVTLRYISLFRKEFRLIKEAMQVRGVDLSFKHPVRTFEYLLVPQLFRCLTLSNDLTSASLTKGLTVPCKRTSYFLSRWSVYDVLIFIIVCLGYGMIVGGVL
ncbi:energy-coupling factor transporter transmembrane component T family protein [Streptococcus pseudoporcinus]|uniref:Cobalt transport protein n=1 Tax=Streptococcus pseudoporcinus TaxID=361101 RepID=A0A4U9XL52_9STRE|nr:energy-coupling factor transporter transmembrane component T [Streptococcus pseudoporcinus]VTS14084.1 cobalt transport protein [Streptococcus pseudoporcinus]VUC66998.1 cobalt transport protein [Streptococcus pseudoporcinus]VUC97926.1 cobalt transport protein [Streptococcus pseudoporcinus]VUC98318.1 cobalt transport protein [Streptococcus pseudoporcinus]